MHNNKWHVPTTTTLYNLHLLLLYATVYSYYRNCFVNQNEKCKKSFSWYHAYLLKWWWYKVEYGKSSRNPLLSPSLSPLSFAWCLCFCWLVLLETDLVFSVFANNDVKLMVDILVFFLFGVGVVVAFFLRWLSLWYLFCLAVQTM